MNYLSYITGMGRHSKKADKYFVYEIVNTMGTIEYVGETYDIEQRFLNHISKSGKFYKRQDIIINIVAEFPTRKEAYAYQCKLQNEYGWESDLDKHQVKLTCPHCNFTSIGYGIYRNHFDRCKMKKGY
jgi:predicted GIY-YIG superfamily endonuclease